MSWQLEGTYFENCNCDSVCPCTTSGLTAPGDQERCLVALFFNVERGEVDGVDVGGLTVGLVADAPALMSEGNWRAGVILDSAGSEEQHEKLGAVFSGQLGGIPAMIAPMIGENLGVQVAEIRYENDGARHRVTVAGSTLEVEDTSQLEDGPLMITGLAFPNREISIAKGTQGPFEAFGLEFGAVGKNGHASPFSWSG